MSEPFLGEIRMFGFTFAPRHWALCNGQVIQIQENPALYSLLGTTFGGNDTTYFNLPDLQGRVPVHTDPEQVYAIDRGIKSGTEEVTLTEEQLPSHTHTFNATADEADRGKMKAGQRVLASAKDAVSGEPFALYGPAVHLKEMNKNSLSGTGENQPHNNTQPSLVVNFCIALAGTYPPRQ